jgi:hypothetical protein
MLTRSLFASWIVIALVAACESGGGGGTTPGTSSSGGGSSGGSSGSSAGDDDECRLRTTLSGGIDATLGEVSQACVYSQRSVGFAPLGGGPGVVLVIEKVERNQTGAFPARIDVAKDDDRWTGATCTVNVESNELADAKSDASMFDQYLLKGSGSCSTPAVYRGDAGPKEDVTIAPFTFVLRTLFY